MRVYLVKYECPEKGTVWWSESLNAQCAFALGRLLAKEGKRPVVVTVKTTAKSIIASGASSSRQALSQPVPLA
jgi:hypothetical protein